MIEDKTEGNQSEELNNENELKEIDLDDTEVQNSKINDKKVEKGYVEEVVREIEDDKKVEMNNGNIRRYLLY